MKTAMSAPPPHHPPATPTSSESTLRVRPPTRSLPMEPVDTTYLEPTSTRNTLTRNELPPRTTTLSRGTPSHTNINSTRGDRRENPLYDMHNNEEFGDDQHYSTMYNIYSTSNEYSTNENSFSCKANRSSIPSKSDESLKKKDGGFNVSCGLALISLLVALAALALTLLLTFGVLQTSPNQMNLPMELPITGALVDSDDTNITQPNNQTEVRLSALTELVDQLNLTVTVSQSELIMQLSNTTFNQSQTIEQLLQKVTDLQGENSQLKRQLNTTVEVSMFNTFSTNNNTQSISLAVDWLLSLNRTLFNLINTLNTVDAALMSQLSELNSTFNYTIEGISTEIKNLRRFDPTLCEHRRELKIFSGQSLSAETANVMDTQTETIISASCSFHSFFEAELVVTKQNGLNDYLCRCKGDRREDTFTEERYCYLDYWICPNEISYT